MLYVELEGKKSYIDPGIAQKYKLKAGDTTPFTGLKIHDDPAVTGTMTDYQPITPTEGRP